jgi:hypothetical protein
MNRPRRATAAAIVTGVVVLLVLWNVRPVFHGLVMFFWTAPLVWLPPLLVIAGGLVVLRSSGQPFSRPAGRDTDPRLDEVRRPRRPGPRPPRLPDSVRPGGVMTLTLGLAFLAFIFGAIVKGPLTSRAIYKATAYKSIPGLPSGGAVRLVPKDVAQQVATSGFNSPTEQLTDFHVVRTPTGQRWTALRSPNGGFRTLTKKSEGIVSLDASSSERRITSTDAEFKYAPKLQITDNLRWQLLKRHFLIDLTQPVGIAGPGGRPLIVVPYLEYKGFLIRRPVLGGVFVVHPGGRIEDLSPAEARKRPALVESGRIFPEELARRIQDAYAYKRGIWNRFFVHEEQTQITDTETNHQPYLIDFGRRGAKWVTVAEPFGRAFAVNAIFLTDTSTGSTQIWRVPKDDSLSGNRRVLQTVRSVSIPGIVFANDSSSDSQSGGRFKVVEPRPVFVGGRLVFLVSVIPEQANSISKSVIVDAARNKVIAIFDNDTDPQADEKVARYLATGRLADEDRTAPAEATSATGTSGAAGASGTTGTTGAATGPLSSAELGRRLDRLAARQRELLREVEALRRGVTAGR